jgi:hypothetical protein
LRRRHSSVRRPRCTHDLGVAKVADGDFSGERPSSVAPFILTNERPNGPHISISCHAAWSPVAQTVHRTDDQVRVDLALSPFPLVERWADNVAASRPFPTPLPRSRLTIRPAMGIGKVPEFPP